MSEDVNRLVLSKKGHREVTPFTGNGMMYDYMSGVLDEERKKTMEAYIEGSPEAQADFQKIQQGLHYAEKLKRITLSSPLKARLSVPSTYLSVLFRKSKFDRWPVGLKWGLEALVVVFVIVTFLTVAPWEKVMRLRLATGTKGVVLSEINKSQPEIRPETQAPAVVEPPQFVDESPIAKETSAPEPKAPVKVAAAPAPRAAEPEEDSVMGAEHAKTSSGFIYRGQIAVTNLEAVGPKIKDKIMELGGRKAGEVELGWRKTPDSGYFHFTIPEAKYPELQAFLSEYGKAKITKDKHPRVMPDGIIRLIITVDEAKK